LAPAAADVLAWSIALPVATFMRLDFQTSSPFYGHFAVVIPLAVGAQLLAGLLSGLYLGRWRFGSFEEAAALARTALMASAVVFGVIAAVTPRLMPMGAALMGGLAAFVLMCGVRYSVRLLVERIRRPSWDSAERLVVFGAGQGGEQAITAMLRARESPYIPVALLDDNKAKRRLRIRGVPMAGSRLDMAEAARRYKADSLLIAIPSAGHELVGQLTDLAKDAKLKVKVLPPVADLLGAVSLKDIRPLTEEDLLGRHEVDIDLVAISQYLTNRRVMVTGAGGSIGSELCNQLRKFSPGELIMVDRDESALHGVQLAIEGRALLTSPDLVLLDLRDRDRVKQMIRARRPEVVFHAAALKHVTLLERHPSEAAKTNVMATLTLLETCAEVGTERFINISTDKAADPTSVLGFSKRICERLTAYFGRTAPGVFLSVRFGNVLGSRGSILPTFKAQIESGGPVTVTHREVSRYFMTVAEAVRLVIQAGAVGRDGETLVLDMGAPVRIAEVAERLVAQADIPVQIVYTGLRPGEKLHEQLFGQGELDERPAHPWISHVRVPPIEPATVRTINPSDPEDVVLEALRNVAFEETTQ
jgi:FlaA1/EpsC-like NDP-sugar epimerase